MKKILIIGSGCIGLSIGYELSKIKKLKIYVVEKKNKFGLGNSSKNSEVIHSGVYYKKNSLKNSLCIDGKKLIYSFCNKHKIKIKKTGKIFFSTNKKEEKYLIKLKQNSITNGVNDVKILSQKTIKQLEPNIVCTKGLLSKSSGIFDSYTFLRKLYYLSKRNKVIFLFNIRNLKLKKFKNYFISNLSENNKFDLVINCAGMNSIKIAKKVFPRLSLPKDRFIKGLYFKTDQKLNIKRILYRAMLPGILSKRVDITPTVDNHYIIGPSHENSKNINISNIRKIFCKELKKLIPNLDTKKIKYYKEGIRPKIYFINKNSNEDFYIKKVKGYNWINLFGIESPGLTSSLSIAKYVKKIINEKNHI